MVILHGDEVFTAFQYKNVAPDLKHLVTPNVTDKGTPGLIDAWLQNLAMAKIVFRTLQYSGGTR
jgi:hypothetical protein